MAGAAEGQAGGLAVRGAALALLRGVVEGGRTLDEQACDPAGPLAALPPSGRARAGRLAASALRQSGRADRLLGPLLRRRPQPEVHAALWLALAETYAEGTPPHAAVDAAVDLVRAAAGPGAAGFANAVLRKAVAAGPEAWAALAPGRVPAWMRRSMVAAWGGAVVEAIEAAHAAPAPPLDLTLRAPDEGAGWAARLGARLLPTGSLRLPAGAQVTALPGFAEGAWWVQDAAAALPARALAPRPGERVADLCAAPGGKTLQLAAAGARVTAVDASAPRLERLRENLARTGLSAEVVAADLRDWQPPAAFDAVLLDAPCTATGTIRRHPDLPFLRREGDLAALVALQADLIDRAVAMTAPGGRLVYAVCSLLPEEGEAQLAAALARHPGLRPDPAALALPGVEPDWSAPGGGLRLRPDFWAGRGGMDGFFVACLRRAG
jgi:16S rRNA (cytosine967-C5)-methyltransferase